MNRTLFLVDSENDYDFITADSNEFLNAPYTPARQFAEKNHAIDVVVF
jgi:hypothetical protein